MRRRGERGYVLVVTIWMLAIITLAAAYFAERVGRSLSLASDRQEVAEQLRAFASTRAEVMFRLATAPITLQGFGQDPAVVPDDRAYRGPDGDIVRIQDNRGLLNVNFHDPGMMLRFLGVLGVPAEKRAAMLDALHDYTDEDDLRRLNGAEIREYQALGLPPPPNEWLTTPHQLKNIIGWRNEETLWVKERITQFTTAARVSGFNPNTAPIEVLASLPGANLESAAAMVQMRRQTPLRSLAQLPAAGAGVSLDPDYISFGPANSVRVTHQHRTLPWAIQYSITLTPKSELRPWRFDYYVRTPVSYVVENEDKIPSLPAWVPASHQRNTAL